MIKYDIENKEPSFLPDGNWSLIFDDEFDQGKLDTSKWDFRRSMMGKECKHWVGDEGIEFDDDNIIFKLIEKDGVYCSSQLQTGYNFMDGVVKENDDRSKYFSWPISEIKENKFVHKYGYYECRCKMQQMDGWWCAFWLQSPIIGSTLSPEISGIEVDIMEQFEKNNTIQHNNYWNGYSSQMQKTGPTFVTLEETKDNYHTFGLDWTADYYRYYVDGRLTLEIKANAPFPVSQTEQFLLLTTEAIGYRTSTWNCWDETKKAVGDKWIVDYVRVFKRK